MYEDLSGLEVPQDLEIVVTTPAYFERLGPLLQNTSQEYVSMCSYIVSLIVASYVTFHP
jgi:hypothetical protein